MATKRIWKFGPNWVGVNKQGKKGIFKTRKLAAAHAGTAKRKTNKKTKTKQKRKSRNPITRAKTRRRSNMAKKKRSRSRAISINLTKLAAVGGTLAMLEGSVGGGLSVAAQLRQGKFGIALGHLFINIRKNILPLIGLNLGAFFLSRIMGRMAPSVGIPGAVNIKVA